MPENNQRIPNKCFLCEHWSIEVTSLNKEEHKRAARAVILDPNRVAGIPVNYGKCRATIINGENEPETMNLGMLSVSDCDVQDYDGYPAFSPISED